MTNRSAVFRIQEEHALAASRLVLKRKLKIPVLPVVLLAIVVGAVGLALGSDGTMGEALPILSWLVLIAALMLGVVQFWILPRQTRRTFRQTSLLREQLTFSWDEEGFALAGESASSRIAWNKLHAWDEADSLFLLMQNEMVYNLVPKSALEEAGIGDLRDCLEKSGLKRL